MFAIDALNILVSYRFIGCVVLAVVGDFIACYILSTLYATRKNIDLSRRLEQWWHVLLLRAFSAWASRALLTTVALCGSTITALLLFDIACAVLVAGVDYRDIFNHNYLPNLAGFGFLAFSFVIQFLLGGKGMAFPIGNKISISFDKGGVLAFHLDEEKPDIRSQESNIRSAIKLLRTKGHNNQIMIKSWLCVTRLASYDPKVMEVRRLFSECSNFTLWIARKAPKTWLFISKKLCSHRFFEIPKSLLKDTINPLAAITYTLINARKIRGAIDQLPSTSMNQSTTKLMDAIRLGSGETVIPIPVAPIPSFTFMNLGQKIPHISKKFMGVDAGFLISQK